MDFSKVDIPFSDAFDNRLKKVLFGVWYVSFLFLLLLPWLIPAVFHY